MIKIPEQFKIKEQVILDEINNLISEELLLKSGKLLKSNE